MVRLFVFTAPKAGQYSLGAKPLEFLKRDFVVEIAAATLAETTTSTLVRSSLAKATAALAKASAALAKASATLVEATIVLLTAKATATLAAAKVATTLTIIATAQHRQFATVLLQNNFRRVLVLAVLILPLAGLQLALDVDIAALAQVTFGNVS